jgi:Mn2+/Fe2+ NRAMP family transporter
MSAEAPEEWSPPDDILGKIKYIALAVGPMAIFMSAAMGPGSISSLVVAGSQLGYDALWIAVISGWLAAGVLFVGGKVCAITGETPVELVNRYTHPVFTYVLFGALLYAWYYVIWVQGFILGEVTAALIPATEPYIEVLVVPALVIVIAAIFVGGFDVAKALLSAFSVFMAVTFFANLFVISPDLGKVGPGLVPGLLAENNSAFAGIIGGAIGIGPIWYAYLAHDNEWGANATRFMAWDNIIFYGILFPLFSVGIYLSAAVTLTGVEVSGAIDAALSLEIAGTAAKYIFSIGLWTAAFTTIGGMAAMASYLVSDLISHLPGTDVDITLSMDDTRFKTILVLGVLSSAIGPFIGGAAPLPFMADAIASFNVVAPTTILIFTIAVVRPRDVGDLTGPWYLVVGLAASFLVTLYGAWISGSYLNGGLAQGELPLFELALGFVAGIVLYTVYREVTDTHLNIDGQWTQGD